MLGYIKFYFFIITKKAFDLFSVKRKKQKNRYTEFKNIIPEFLSKNLSANKPVKKILIFSNQSYDITDLYYIKCLEDIGYEIHVLVNYFPFAGKILSLFGINNIHYVQKYKCQILMIKIKKEIKKALIDIKTKDDLLNFSIDGVKIGKYAVSWALRISRKSTLDFNDENMKKIIFNQLINSYLALKIAVLVYKTIKPDLLFLTERSYTPFGQMYDICLNNKVQVIQRCASQKSGYDILKRYTNQSMTAIHHHTLSNSSWDKIKKMKWTDEKWQLLYNDLYKTYSSGDWYSEVGTQFNKKLFSKHELIDKLKIDKSKKTAIVFAHMFWDATFFWGEDIFDDYYDWFINLLKIANQNKNLNWLIKIHPANTVKAKRDNFTGEHNEIIAIRETLGEIPDHIKIIPSESEINTFSLFSLMDYCLTVRGTIGIESAMFGINTITAGTGRYDGLGFTYDFKSKEEYIDFIYNLHKIGPMSEDKIELARRFAFGIFILRPINVNILNYYYSKDENTGLILKPLFNNIEELKNYTFFNEFINYIQSKAEDYLDNGMLK